MAHGKTSVSQADFDSAVQEAMEALGLTEDEAIVDTIEAFELQGADLTGVVTSKDGSAAIQENPTVTAVTKLSEALQLVENFKNEAEKRGETVTDRGEAGSDGEGERERERALVEALRDAVDVLILEIEKGGEGSTVIAGKNKAVELTLKACEAFGERREEKMMERSLTLANLLVTADVNKLAFYLSGGPQILVTSLSPSPSPPSPSLVHVAASLAATAGTRFEVTKEALMDKNAHEIFVWLMKCHVAHSGAVLGTIEAIRGLVTNDDGRVEASKTFLNAQKIAEAGAVETILEAARVYREDPKISSSICIGLTAVAVNEKICRSVADLGGVGLAINFLSKASIEKRSTAAKASCSLLRQLAGSDENKIKIVREGGIKVFLETASTFSQEPNIIQESFACLVAITLRQPLHSSKAVEEGAPSILSESMAAHPDAKGMQRQACQLVRNLAVRNLENRPILLELGIDGLIRKAKANHKQCEDVALFALQALGLD